MIRPPRAPRCPSARSARAHACTHARTHTTCDMRRTQEGGAPCKRPPTAAPRIACTTPRAARTSRRMTNSTTFAWCGPPPPRIPFPWQDSHSKCSCFDRWCAQFGRLPWRAASPSASKSAAPSRGPATTTRARPPMALRAASLRAAEQQGDQTWRLWRLWRCSGAAALPCCLPPYIKPSGRGGHAGHMAQLPHADDHADRILGDTTPTTAHSPDRH